MDSNLDRRSTVSIGREAESRVASLYKSHGFELIGRNVRVGALELDLILRRGHLLVVCEVKHRRNLDFGHPALAVSQSKRARLRRASARWLGERDLQSSFRFDVATIVGDPTEGQIEIFTNAF